MLVTFAGQGSALRPTLQFGFAGWWLMVMRRVSELVKLGRVNYDTMPSKRKPGGGWFTISSKVLKY